MTDSSAPTGWIWSVGVITLAQAALALMTRALPLFALPLTLAAGVDPAAAGQMAAATSLGSMIFFLWGPALMAGVASMRQLQLGLGLAGLAVLLCLQGSWAMILAAALLIGVGYGPSAPAGSAMLMSLVPKSRRNLVFSVKQAGVPLGGLVAGLVLPAVGAVWGIGAAMLAACVMTLAVIPLLAGAGAASDPADRVARRLDIRELAGAPLRLARIMLASAALRRLVVVGLCLGAAQGVLFAYYPLLLGDGAGWSLTATGLAFAVLQGAGIFGRIAMGWLADRVGNGARVLALICLGSGLTMMALATTGPDTPVLMVGALALIAGVTVVSWNGVFVSQVASRARPDQVGMITSAATFVLFAGYVASPLLAQLCFLLADSYVLTFAVAGLIPLLGGIAMLRVPPGHEEDI